MSITNLIIHDKNRKKQHEDDQRPAIRIPAIDPSTWPDIAPKKKEVPPRGVRIINNGDEDDGDPDGSPRRGVVITNRYDFN